MRVLLLVTDAYGGHGGIAAYNRALCEAIAAMPEVAEVVVVPRVMRFAPQRTPAKVRFIAAAAGTKLRFVATVASMLGECFDLVICGHMNLLPIAFSYARLRKAPLVLQVHGIDAWRAPRWPASAMVRRVAHVWSVSGFTAERMNQWANLQMSQYEIIPNTIHPEHFGMAPRSPQLEQRYGLAGRKVVMTLARLAGFERYKGIDEVLLALPALITAEPTLVYMIVGDGNDMERLQRKVRARGLQDYVRFTGFVQESEKADHVRLADAFVMPGRGEGFGIVLLEAMACGVPVVGSRLDGSREALLEGRLGALVDPNQIDTVVHGILAALRRPKAVPAGLESFYWPHFQSAVGRALRGVAERTLVEDER